MFTEFKAWFIETKNDFKSFAIRQANVLIGIAVLYFLAYLGAYLYASNSAPYKAAAAFIKSSPIIVSQLGNLSDVSLQPFGYDVRWRNGFGKAEMEVAVVGDKNNCRVRAYLENNNDEWTLEKAHCLFPNHDVIPLKQ